MEIRRTSYAYSCMLRTVLPGMIRRSMGLPAATDRPSGPEALGHFCAKLHTPRLQPSVLWGRIFYAPQVGMLRVTPMPLFSCWINLVKKSHDSAARPGVFDAFHVEEDRQAWQLLREVV